jgi:hypothetical protein
MHAVLVSVTVNDPEPATAALRDQVVPQVSGSPGFVAGYWVRLEGDQGRAIIVYESEDAARAASEQVQQSGEFVTIDRITVAEVVASA